MSKLQPIPVVDLHCDLLYYLAMRPDADLFNTNDIGAALPHLQAGNVKHQIMAIFTLTQKGSVHTAKKQAATFHELTQSKHFEAVTSKATANQILTRKKVGITAALESASTLCEEDEPLDLTFIRLDEMLSTCGHLFYISFTHHTENRFGGGNYSDNIGLKRDGELLLEYMNGKGIAVDLAHSSDNLAHDMINYIDKKGLDIPVIASHSNFRSLSDHVRNLPSALIKEIQNRNGLLGMNFLRAYIHDTDADYFYKHLHKGLNELPNEIAWGADFFYRHAMKDPKRYPLFFPEHEDASKYPILLNKLSEQHDVTALEQMSYGNVLRYINNFWKG